MGCSFDKDILNRSVNGKIDPLERVFMEEHVKNCGECKEFLKNIEIVGNTEKKSLFGKLALNKTDSMGKRISKSVDKVKNENENKSENDSKEKSENLSNSEISNVNKEMGIVEVTFRGATGWLRIVPFGHIIKDIYNSRK